MPLVDIYLSGRKYTVSCEAGHEPRLRELADHVGGRLRELNDSGVTGSDAHMLVLACLVITDQLFDAVEGADRPRLLTTAAQREAAQREAAQREAAQKEAAQKDVERAAAVDNVTRRIEDLAVRLEQA